MLYLGAFGVYFGGDGPKAGNIGFLDEDADRAWRLSQGDWLHLHHHRVVPISWGSRHVLGLWFTRTPPHGAANISSTAVAAAVIDPGGTHRPIQLPLPGMAAAASVTAQQAELLIAVLAVLATVGLGVELARAAVHLATTA